MEISHPRLVEMICVNLSLCLYNTMMIHTICYIQYLIIHVHRVVVKDCITSTFLYYGDDYLVPA